MVSHVYGRLNVLTNPESRPNMFVKELKLYLTHLEKEIQAILPNPTEKQCKLLQTFRLNLCDGINYYKKVLPDMLKNAVQYTDQMKRDLAVLQMECDDLVQRYTKVFRSIEDLATV